ncbi:DUF1338 domain-containing protein [Thiotrichales bacterium 19S9-12]|nr:DUF1338 domain-containing protein [Thiotrichales bacterium 19S9-11]MCF6812011.1 DUF1338 domain-containing protein [Thiotrichales bacterium 19S9-12]
MNHLTLDELFNHLWQQYISDSPQAAQIHQLFIDQGEEVINDHIAIRTFDDSRVNVEHLASFFKHLGYEEKGQYTFDIKKLNAKHYEHKDNPNLPKIFISELKTKDFSERLQSYVTSLVDQISPELLSSDKLLYSGTAWQKPLDYDIYQALLEESEYAAWVYAFGFRANHFTVNVNHMQNIKEITDINQLLKDHGYQLNASGGEVKGTPSDLLEQSSTLANQVEVEFKQGKFSIPNSYYEFAKRYNDSNGNLYQGFIAASADKIFESTDTKQQ